MPSPFFEEWTRANEAHRPSAARQLIRRVPMRWRAGAGVSALLGLAATAVLLPGAVASADPSANTWYRLRVCESGNDYSINTGNDHYGAYQFDLSTWRSVGGHGYPNQASKAEQDARALILYRERGWQPWQCGTILGLHDDKDARSGRISDIRLPAANSGGSTSGGGGTSGGGAGAAGIPAFPGGSHWYTYGETTSQIKVFQDQMHRRGFFPVGTGQYGPNTLRMVKQLQRLNGLVPNGYIGPNTWRLAWVGRYSESAAAATPTIPAFPGGSHWYTYGEQSAQLKVFQSALVKRGILPGANGAYGPTTLRVVEQLQRLNGLVPNGYVGPNTWRLAWVGSYHR